MVKKTTFQIKLKKRKKTKERKIMTAKGVKSPLQTWDTPEGKVYKIPVSYLVHDCLEIRAESLEDALRKAEEPETVLLQQPVYSEGTFEIDLEGAELMNDELPFK